MERLDLKSANAEPDGVLEMVFGNADVFGGVDFFVWFDRDGDRGIIVMDESQHAGEDDTAEPGAAADGGGR